MPLPSFSPLTSALSAEQLHALRRDLRSSLVALDRHCGAVEPAHAETLHAPTPCPFAALLAGLEASGAVRILRRLDPDDVDATPAGRPPGTSIAVIVDVETTGLDHGRDEVIELGMLRFEHVDGEVERVTGELCALREPGRPISPEITRLTGITPEMVAGCTVDPDAVSDLLLGADLVVAHNAAFDRPFCEALHPAFAGLPWACSVQEVDWSAGGFEGAKLGHLLLQSGAFNRGHRALDDCRALLHLLRLGRAATPGGLAAPLLRGLVVSAAETRRRIWAEGAPFEKKDVLKARGYRWSPGGAASPKAWWRDVREEDLRAETAFLHAQVYSRHRLLRTERLTARDRYRPR